MKLKVCSDCQVPSKLWKSSPPLCQSCARKTYKPLKRSEIKIGDLVTINGSMGKVVSIKPTIAPLSKKRQKQDRVYQTLRKVYLENHQLCKAQLGGCTGNSTEIHHKKGRTEQLLTDIQYFLPVCRNCHDFIEMNSKKAKELGLSLNRL